MTWVTVTIDTEEEWDWSGPFPVRDHSVENIASLQAFQAVCARHGIRPTYFVNHAVLADADSRRVIARLAGMEGVEIGMHLHPWNTPPIQSERVVVSETFTENLPEEQIVAKLASTWERFGEMGLAPRSYRGGRYSSGPVVRRFLADHSFLVDASVCPYTSWDDPGAPDYRRRGPEVRRVDGSDGRSLWEVPLTRAFTKGQQDFWAKFYDSVEGSPLRHARLIGILERLRLVERVWLNFECEEESRMLRFLPVAKRHRYPHICFTVHSSSLAPGPGPYCRTREDQQRIFEAVESVFAAVQRDDDLVPVTMTELAHHLEGHDEGDRNQPAG